MVGFAGALVLNIGTLSSHWVDAMLAAGRAANARGIPVVLDPVGAGATSYRTETARRILGELDVAVLRGNAGEIAALVGVEAEMRGVESIGGVTDVAARARQAARALNGVASVTGPIDHVSDGDRSAAIANGHPMLATITGTRVHVERNHGVLRRRGRGRPSELPSRRSSLSEWPARTPLAGREGRARSMSISTTRWPRWIRRRSTTGRT